MASHGQQFPVITGFHHRAVSQHHDAIGTLHGGEPVGNHQRGAISHELTQRRLDMPF